MTRALVGHGELEPVVVIEVHIYSLFPLLDGHDGWLSTARPSGRAWVIVLPTIIRVVKGFDDACKGC